MRVIIIGAAGFIGSHLAVYLAKKGVEVVPVTRACCNLNDMEAVRRFFSALPQNPYAVVHLASPPKASHDYRQFLRHIGLIRNVSKALNDVHVTHFIYTSSFDIYGSTPTLPITEATLPQPDSWYGLAKFVAERLFQTNIMLRGRTIILRLPGIYSCNGDDNGVIGRMYNSILSGGEILLENNGANLRDLVEVDDVCHALAVLLDSPPQDLTLNMASGISCTIAQVVRLLEKKIGITAHCRFMPPTERSFDITVNPERYAAACGFLPTPLVTVWSREC